MQRVQGHWFGETHYGAHCKGRPRFRWCARSLKEAEARRRCFFLRQRRWWWSGSCRWPRARRPGSSFNHPQQVCSMAATVLRRLCSCRTRCCYWCRYWGLWSGSCASAAGHPGSGIRARRFFRATTSRVSATVRLCAHSTCSTASTQHLHSTCAVRSCAHAVRVLHVALVRERLQFASLLHQN